MIHLDPHTLSVFERLNPKTLTVRDSPGSSLDDVHIVMAEAISDITARMQAQDRHIAHADEMAWRAEWRGRVIGAVVGAAAVAGVWGWLG